MLSTASKLEGRGEWCRISISHPKLSDLGREPSSSHWSWCYTCLHYFAWHGEQIQGGAASFLYLFHTKLHVPSFIHPLNTWQSPALCLALCWALQTRQQMDGFLASLASLSRVEKSLVPQGRAPCIFHIQNKTLSTCSTLHTLNIEISTNSVWKLHLNLSTKMWFQICRYLICQRQNRLGSFSRYSFGFCFPHLKSHWECGPGLESFYILSRLSFQKQDFHWASCYMSK